MSITFEKIFFREYNPYGSLGNVMLAMSFLLLWNIA